MTTTRVETNETHTAHRVLVGHCPQCGSVVVVFNNYGGWPLVACGCGWVDGTTGVQHGVVYERDGQTRVVTE